MNTEHDGNRALFVGGNHRQASALNQRLRLSVSIVFVETAEEALSRIQREEFTLVFVDDSVSDMGAVDLLWRLALKRPEMGRALLVSSAQACEVRYSLDAGLCTWVIQKPSEDRHTEPGDAHAQRLTRMLAAVQEMHRVVESPEATGYGFLWADAPQFPRKPQGRPKDRAWSPSNAEKQGEST